MINDHITLDLFGPGRALFTVKAGAALSGVVMFSCGYDGQQLHRYFLGYIETSTTVDDHQQRIFCRELSAALSNRVPLGLRNVSLKKVLSAITTATQLQFVVNDEGEYADTPVGMFYNTGAGFGVMDSLPRVFQYGRGMWQQQVDGKIFVGAWDHSRWSARAVTVPRKWETNVTAANGATVALFPALRPGVHYNGNILTSVALSGGDMQIKWHRDPWAEAA